MKFENAERYKISNPGYSQFANQSILNRDELILLINKYDLGYKYTPACNHANIGTLELFNDRMLVTLGVKLYQY